MKKSVEAILKKNPDMEFSRWLWENGLLSEALRRCPDWWAFDPENFAGLVLRYEKATGKAYKHERDYTEETSFLLGEIEE